MIFLARHGETTWNKDRRFQGPRGGALAQVAAGHGFAALYTSPLVRARETAEIVGAALGLEARVDDRLKEVDVGDWQGRYKEELARDDPDAWAAFGRAGEDFRFPGGESLAGQQKRVIAALVDITQHGELPALVVCHRGVVRCALAHTHNRGLDTYHEWKVPNGELIRL